MRSTHFLFLVGTTAALVGGAAFYFTIYDSEQVVTEGLDTATTLTPSTTEESIGLQTETVATSSKISVSSLDSQSTDIKKQVVALDDVNVVLNSYPMEDLILQPNEVPAGYLPQKAMANSGAANPGFIIEDQRDATLSLAGASPEFVKRIYAGVYKNYSNMDDLFMVVYEYENLSDQQIDLKHISEKVNEVGVGDRSTVTAFQNYIIFLYDDNSVDMAAELTEQLRLKIPGVQSSEIVTPNVSNQLSSSYTMEDLILEPYEVPVGYALQGVVGYEDVLNPGFVTGELRDEILSGDAVGASPDLVKRVYMVHYEGSDSDKLTIVVLEYEKLANMKSDLTNISSNIVKQGVEGYATVTAIDNYVIYLYDDNSPELTAQLTEKLQSKLPD